MKKYFLKVNSLALYALAYSASAAVHKGIGFLLFMWLAHSLSVENYAKFGLLYALQAGVAGIAAAGVIEVVIGLLKSHESQGLRAALFNSANSVFIILVSGCLVIVAIASSVLVNIIDITYGSLVVVVFGGLLTAFFAMQSQLTRLEENHATALALNFFPPIAGLTGGLISLYIVPNVSSFFTGTSVGLIIALLVFGLARIGHYGFAYTLKNIVPILVKIFPFILIAVLGWINGYGNTYLVQHHFTSVEVARFVFAYTLSSIMQLVATSLNQVWSPRIFKILHTMPIAEVEQKNKRFFKLQGLILGLISSLILLLAPVLTQFGGSGLAAYRDLTYELLFLFSAYALSIPWYHAQNYYFVFEKGKQLMYITIISSLVGIGLWLMAMLIFGSIGIYIGFMLTMSIRTLAALFWARREWPICIVWEGPIIALVLMASACVLTKILVI